MCRTAGDAGIVPVTSAPSSVIDNPAAVGSIGVRSPSISRAIGVSRPSAAAENGRGGPGDSRNVGAYDFELALQHAGGRSICRGAGIAGDKQQRCIGIDLVEMSGSCGGVRGGADAEQIDVGARDRTCRAPAAAATPGLRATRVKLVDARASVAARRSANPVTFASVPATTSRMGDASAVTRN